MSDSSSAAQSDSNTSDSQLHLVPPPAAGAATAIIPGGFWRRAAAVLIDAVLLFFVEKPVFMLIGIAAVLNEPVMRGENISLSPEQRGAHLIAFGVGALIQTFYAYGFYRWKSATIGKLALGLKVVDRDTGEKLTFGQTVIREFFGKTFSAVLFLGGYLMVPFRRDKRALHDFMASTQVQRRQK